MSDGFDPAAVAQQIRFTHPLPEQPTPAARPEPAGPYRIVGNGEILPRDLTDRGLAKTFSHLFAADFRHVSGLGWHRWSGYRWVPDEHDTVVDACGEMAERLAHRDPDHRHSDAELRRERRRAQSTGAIKAILTQAKSAAALRLDAAAMDADPYALCTPEGLVDLRTGAVRAPDPRADFHSKATTVGPRTQPTPRWDQFLADTFGDDTAGREMTDYLHRLLGYSITGDVGAQVLPFLYGSGKNGKSVLLDVLVKLLGDYADVASPGFLMAKQYEGHPTDLAELHGRRVIVCSELNLGDRFDESRVKLLTGGEKIKARRMRQDPFSFHPTQKLFLIGNHRPEVAAGGFAFWRRIRLIPFERTVPDARKVYNLADLLVSHEGPGILAWLIAGARRYLGGETDLTGPQPVQVATTAYAETEDHMGRFLSEACKITPEMRAEQTHLYRAYSRWCEAEGASPVSARAFAARVRDTLGMRSPKEMATSSSKKYYPGIGLIIDDEETT